MKPAPFRYERPSSLEEAAEMLESMRGEARVLAGGQSLVPMLNLRLAVPAVVVDINWLHGLERLDCEESFISVGALVRQRRLERSAQARQCGALCDCLPLIGHVGTRNRGTVGGSLAHADPAGELGLVLVGVGGEVLACDARGERRTIDSGSFFEGFLSSALGPAEVLTEARFHRDRPGRASAFIEAAPRHGDFASASVCACVELDSSGATSSIRLALGAVTDRPFLAGLPDDALAGWRGDKESADELAALVASSIEPLGTLHAPPQYQRHLIGVLGAQALLKAFQRAKQSLGNGDHGEEAHP